MTIKTKRKLWQSKKNFFFLISLRQILNVVTTALSATKENHKTERSECL